MVEQLRRIIFTTNQRQTKSRITKRKKQPQEYKTIVSTRENPKKAPVKTETSAPDFESIIPLDDDDLKDF
jgi:hypothetical protein